MDHDEFDVEVIKDSLGDIISKSFVSDRRLKGIIRRLLGDFKCDDIDELLGILNGNPDIWEKYLCQSEKKILVVEDSESFAILIRKMLEEEGYTVICAYNGEDCKRLVKQEKFDLITMDVELPDTDGYTLGREIGQTNGKVGAEQHNSKIPIIMITSRDTLADRENGLEIGAKDFVVKSLVRSELTFAIGKILDSSCHFSGMKVLVVDNMAVVRKIIATMLRSKNIDVIEASTCKEAYDLIAKNRKTIDMVVTSYGVEKMSGVDLCHDIRKKLSIRSIPIILITTDEERERLIKFFNAGGSDYLRKSIIKEELEPRLFVHLESRYFYKKMASTANCLIK